MGNINYSKLLLKSWARQVIAGCTRENAQGKWKGAAPRNASSRVYAWDDTSD